MQDMTSTPPPYMFARASAVPVVDRRQTPEKLGPSAMLGGFPTPPLSAHESRRPSLTLSSFSDPSYASSSSYSQPATPVDTAQHPGHSFPQHYGNATDISRMAVGDMAAHLAPGHPIPIVPRPQTFHSLPCQNPQSPWYGPCASGPIAGGFGALTINTDIQSMEPHYWTHGTLAYNLHQHQHQEQDCKSRFLANTIGLGHDSHLTQPLYSSAGPFSESVPHSQSVQTCHGLPTTTCWQDSQVVVPSQLIPEDEYDPYHYDAPNNSPGSGHVANSFASTTCAFSGYEDVDPPSPDQDYYSVDDDTVVIKASHLDSPGTPTKSQWSSPSRRSHVSTPTKLRKRLSKRKVSTKTYSFSSAVSNVEVSLDARVSIDENNHRKWTGSNNNKSHKCSVCSTAFERSEHLKRHMGKHSQERPYRCPLYKFKDSSPEKYCGKCISRPDNACDHIKTHLRAARKGARNKHIGWTEMELLIRETFNDERATKMLTNLRKWKEAGMP